MATLGCIQAKMGRTTYYICKMAAGELIDKVGIAKELPEWPDMTAEEKMQRECDIKRIVEEIVPYVTDDPDRFFSSLIHRSSKRIVHLLVNLLFYLLISNRREGALHLIRKS